MHNDPLHAAINAKLAAIVEASSLPPAWRDAWMELGPESSEEERLAVYQAIRDSGCLPADAGFYLVSWQIDAMTSQDAEIVLCHLEVQLGAIAEAHGLQEGEFWPPGKVPKEYKRLRREYQDAWEKLFVTRLEEYGEHDMARQFRADPEGFDKRSSAGQAFFHGREELEAESDAPQWLQSLVETVAGCMESQGPGTLGFSYWEEEGFWQLAVYPKSVELVGGADDGEIVIPGFSLDLEELRGGFERVDALAWQSLGYPNGEGPHVAIEGVYQGHEVYIQVLSYAPEDEGPGMKLDTTRP